MANPGAASTTTNHPSNLATNQALRLIASAQGVNLNLVADTVAPILVSGRVSVAYVLLSNASTSLTTAAFAVYTGAGATGTTVLSATTPTGATTAAKVVNTAASSTDAITGGNLYIRNTTAQTAAATADIFIYGYDLTFLP
jgi:multidrug transporter EmrE-like cation transporter